MGGLVDSPKDQEPKRNLLRNGSSKSDLVNEELRRMERNEAGVRSSMTDIHKKDEKNPNDPMEFADRVPE